MFNHWRTPGELANAANGEPFHIRKNTAGGLYANSAGGKTARHGERRRKNLWNITQMRGNATPLFLFPKRRSCRKKTFDIIFFPGTLLPTSVVFFGGFMTDFMKPRKVAERLGVSKHTVIRMVERGELEGIRVAHQYRIRPESVERLINPNFEEKRDE